LHLFAFPRSVRHTDIRVGCCQLAQCRLLGHVGFGTFICSGASFAAARVVAGFTKGRIIRYRRFEMSKDIASRLRGHLSKAIETEPDVVYLMAEVRKLLDRDDKEHNNKAIWMYCHWALHVDLTKGGTTGQFLKTIDRWVSTPSHIWSQTAHGRSWKRFTCFAISCTWIRSGGN